MGIDYLVTIEQAMNFVYLDPSDYLDDIHAQERFEIFRKAVCETIEEYVGYNILSQDYIDEKQSGNSRHQMYLNHRPITVLTTVKYNSAEQTLGNFEIIDDEYLYHSDGEFFTESLYWWEFTYTAGWTADTMPASLRLAALELISLANSYSGPSSNLGITSSSAGESSKSFDTETEQKVLDLRCHKYRRG